MIFFDFGKTKTEAKLREFKWIREDMETWEVLEPAYAEGLRLMKVRVDSMITLFQAQMKAEEVESTLPAETRKKLKQAPFSDQYLEKKLERSLREDLEHFKKCFMKR